MTTSGSSIAQDGNGDGSAKATIDGKLEAARRRLLDLTTRNRLLNFRTARRAEQESTSTADQAAEADSSRRRRTDRRSMRLVDTEASELYRLLVTDEKTVEIVAADERTEVAVATGTEPIGTAQPPSLPAPGNHKQPTAQAELNSEQLTKRLLFLAREAESALQEQGCNILFLAIGMLEWTETEAGAESAMAPVILVPIELIRRDVQQRYKIRWFDDAPVVNPTLIELCRSNFRLELPELNVDSATPVEDLFHTLEQQISQIKGWAVHRQVHLGLFSFAKLLMYLDLNPSRWPQESKINAHPLVQALCGLGGN